VRERPARLFGDCVSLVLPIALAFTVGNAVLTSGAEMTEPVTPYALSGYAQPAGPVPFWTDSRFTPSEAEAVRAAFAQWQDGSDARVTFTYMGPARTGDAATDDGRNVVVRSAAALPRGRGDTIARTVRNPASTASNAPADRMYRDADIVIDFSGRVPWSTDGAARDYDLQSVTAHEVGHLLGLEDVSDPGQLMYWLSRPGELGKHYVHSGDLEGLMRAYPRLAEGHAP
jgi:hypothetical protein